ncbi:hypothetical protein [Mucilaginibacter aquaedulcis]|uniref:hypothetical protein n=1 Tax=Mucilaginibacter aquaedulcis TaxID=1187081 RepID=UPI0025B5D7D8|nr:hypothetical protein [Mucilaginibacter aquaedulcis]MDN3548870.1 hypothetical protein [Mucilaginibacter aquaedulcis]
MNKEVQAVDQPVLSGSILIRYINCITNCALQVPDSIVETITGRNINSSSPGKAGLEKKAFERFAVNVKGFLRDPGHDHTVSDDYGQQWLSEAAHMDMSA